MNVILSRIEMCLVLVCMMTILLPRIVFAHCDTMDGPVVKDAQVALERNDITPVLKWVKPESESEIREAFARTITVRKLGAEAKNLVDMWFFETLVRVYHAGEGAPYTGLKPVGTPPEPPVAAADNDIETASADALVKLITNVSPLAFMNVSQESLRLGNMQTRASKLDENSSRRM